jgi:predicted DNA-binding transcriptional regulator YafY
MARHDQMARLLRVARELGASKRGVARRPLAERHGWSLRALYRDVEALELAGFPVIRDGGRFRLPPDWMSSGGAQALSPEERLALFLARQLAAAVRDTSAGRALERLWNRLAAGGGGTGALLPESAPPLAVRSLLAIDYAPHRTTIATIETALREGRVLACEYDALSSGETTRRAVEPGELYWDPSLEALYLVAWCRLREAPRVFAVHRFRSVSLTDERCPRRPEISSRAALRDALRVWRGQAATRVAVRLRGWAAREARERTLHPSQKVTRIAPDEVRVELEVAGEDEVLRWVLGYGALAVVEAPPALVARVRDALAAAAAAYSPTAIRRPARANVGPPSGNVGLRNGRS